MIRTLFIFFFAMLSLISKSQTMNIYHGTCIIVHTDIQATYITADSKLINSENANDNPVVNKIIEHNGFYYAKSGFYKATHNDPSKAVDGDIAIQKQLIKGKPFKEVLNNVGNEMLLELNKVISILPANHYLLKLEKISEIVIATNFNGHKKVGIIIFIIRNNKLNFEVVDLSDPKYNGTLVAIGLNDVVNTETGGAGYNKYFKNKNIPASLNKLMRMTIDKYPKDVGYPIRTVVIRKKNVEWLPDITE